MGKTINRQGTPEDKMLSQSTVKGPVKVSQKLMWFDLIAARIPPKRIDWQLDALFDSL